jgi:hypothetical protein
MFKRLRGLPFFLLMAASTSAFAQDRHAVDPEELAKIVAQHTATEDGDRDAIRDALAHPRIQEVASRFGIDVARLDASVETLTGDHLERAAAAARQINSSLVGGASTIVISTTAVIIVLLLVLILVAL